tara:strand:- start:273 stop:428 length:156 start_codon:yes stop_codon:yes gene_type:complete
MIDAEHIDTLITVTMSILAIEEESIPKELKELARQNLVMILKDSYDPTSLN